MDRITSNLLKEFVATHGLDALSESEAFENFVNYGILFREFVMLPKNWTGD